MSGSYLDDKTFDRIKQAVTEGKTHIVAAYDNLMASADKLLESRPPSVTQNGGSKHFRQDAIYIPDSDGVINDDSNRQSGELLGQFSNSSFDLAIAWRLTGDVKYADKALEYIHCWCINQESKMLPDGRVFDNFTPGMGYGGDICLFHHLPPAFLAMFMMKNYSGWNVAAHGAVKSWVRAMIEPQTPEMFFQGVSMYNNWEDNRLNYLACGALFLDDLGILHNVFNRWRTIIPLKMTDQGELHRETMRTRSMTYTLFALNMCCQVAEIASGFGENLHDCNINGRSLKLAVDYVTKYLLDIESWPFELIDPITPGKDTLALSILEFAHSKWPEQKYLDAIELWGGRPVDFYRSTLLMAK